MAGPPTTVWVEVATELLAELGDWSEPVRVRIDDLRPDGRVQMVLQQFDDGKAALALALRLLDAFTVNDNGVCARYGARTSCEAHEMWNLDPEGPCPGAEAHALLVRHGIREA